MEPSFVPKHSKPDAPGVWMNFDNTVSLYYIVEPDDSFEQAAQALFALLKEAQAQFPDWPRLLYLDVLGHQGDRAGYDPDFFEFQQDFLFATIAPFVTALETPLTGPLLNPDTQRNDVPDDLVIKPPDGEAPGA